MYGTYCFLKYILLEMYKNKVLLLFLKNNFLYYTIKIIKKFQILLKSQSKHNPEQDKFKITMGIWYHQ
jgi:hypothetical protein